MKYESLGTYESGHWIEFSLSRLSGNCNLQQIGAIELQIASDEELNAEIYYFCVFS